MKYEWRNYRPEGWTDDLGIIADQNRWLREELAGWYVFVPHHKAVEVHEWCKNNLKDDWNYGAGIPERKLRIGSDRDFAWFSMKWL